MSKAACISSSDFNAGLHDDVNGYVSGESQLGDLHVDKGLGVREGLRKLDLLEDVAMAVDWRVAWSDDGAVAVKSRDGGR